MKTDTSRRGFLGAAAGLAGLAAAGAPAHPPRSSPNLGASSSAWPVTRCAGSTRAKAIEMVKALQTPWISLKDMHMPFDYTPSNSKRPAPNMRPPASGS